jgi:uncharacterized damage-inducible protein DinB
MQKAFQKGRGLGAHSLLDALEGLTAEQAAWKPQGQKTRSIWEIVKHIASGKEFVVRRLDSELAAIEEWPKIEEVSEEAWAETLEQLKRCQERLFQAVGKLKDEQLEEPIGEHLFGLIAHDCYHTGQILTLRQLQGIGLD